MAFPKVKFIVGTFIVLVCLLASPRSAYAQCLINIPDWSAGQVTTCLEPGGTIGLVGSYGNFGTIYEQTAAIVRQYNQTQSGNNRVTLEYRLYNDARPSTAEEIQSVVAIIQQNPINAPAMLRVNNEWTDSYVWPGMDFASRVSNYLQTQYTAWQTIQDSGGGIVLVDGMLDYWSGVDMDQVINAINGQVQSGQFPGWNSWADTFDVLAINGYFEPGKFGQLGNTNLSQVLGTLQQLAPGKPWRFSEFGYKPKDGHPQYDNPELIKGVVIDLFKWFRDNPEHIDTFAGFNIFTRDPHQPDSKNIAFDIMVALNSPEIQELISKNPELAGVMHAIVADLADQTQAQEWLNQLLQDGILVECKNDAGAVIGYAPTEKKCQVQLQMPQAPTDSCTAQGAEQKGLLRPAPCKNCSLDVPQPTNACAEPLTLIQPETWTCGELTGCPDPVEGRYFIKEVTWSADFFLNTQDTKVPFSGYRDLVTDEKNKVKNLNYYLADYFEGTTLLDGKPFDPTDPQQVREGIMNAGVFRKLAPLAIQDQLREKLILSGLNYEVTDGKTSKHLQDWWPNRPLPPTRYPTGYFPPDRNNPNYVQLYQRWLDNPWGKLWQRIPLFTREDAPGKVKLAVEHDPGLLEPNSPAGRPMAYYSAEFPLAFPHLARTYEASDNLNKLLMPTIEAARTQTPISAKPGRPNPCASIFGEGIETALGCMPTTAIGLASWFLQYGSFIAGGLAFLLMGYGAFLFITSAGNEEKVAKGKTIITAAIIGLLVIVGAVFILRLVIVQILKIPGFSEAAPAPNPAPTQLTATNPLVALAKEIGNTVESTKKIIANVQSASYQPVLLAQAKPVLLAQAEGASDFPPDDACGIKVDPNNDFFVKIYNNRRNECGIIADPQNFTVTYAADGGPAEVACNISQLRGEILGDYNVSELMDGACRYRGREPQRSLQISVSYTNARGDQRCGKQVQNNVTLTKDATGAWVPSCGSLFTGAPPDKTASCTNGNTIDGECSGNDPQEDRHPNDPVCCDAQAHVEVPDYRIVAFRNYSDYEKACLCDPDLDEDCNPAKIHNVQMSRKVSVKLKIPYLEKIWEDSTKDEFGFFNLFRPAHFPKFPDDDALSSIRYQLTSPGSTIDPPVGELYYPYLGGIQETKKCISEQFLLPKALQPETNYCQFWDDYLKFQSRYQGGTSGFSVDDGSELDNMDCQNADFKISDAAKQNAITTANQSWPENLLEERWDDVVGQAQDSGWNPACVVALWIEESGGSDLEKTGAKYSLGCEGATSSDPNTNLNQSLDCFFSREDHPYYSQYEKGSREWWLVYAEGPNNSGVFDGSQANFPKNLYSWYQRLNF